MNKKSLIRSAPLVLALAAAPALASPDWNKAEAVELMLFFPGQASIEWVLGDIRIGRERHQGSRVFRLGDRCIDCHLEDPEELVDIGAAIASGESGLEPTPRPGKPGTIPVQVQALHDGGQLFLRFRWQQPPAGGGEKMDSANPMKISFMLDAGNVALADQSGCWASCHADSRGMSEGDDNRGKYVSGGSLADGVFYDLLQWRSGENKAADGHVADTRVMEGGTALKQASGKLDGDHWTVEFVRNFKGGDGDITLERGKVYNIGVAIHDDHAAGRFHHVTLGYTLGIDADADIVARHD